MQRSVNSTKSCLFDQAVRSLPVHTTEGGKLWLHMCWISRDDIEKLIYRRNRCAAECLRAAQTLILLVWNVTCCLNCVSLHIERNISTRKWFRKFTRIQEINCLMLEILWGTLDRPPLIFEHLRFHLQGPRHNNVIWRFNEYCECTEEKGGGRRRMPSDGWSGRMYDERAEETQSGGSVIYWPFFLLTCAPGWTGPDLSRNIFMFH